MMLVSWAAVRLENLEKMHRTAVMSLFPGGLEQEREAHRIVRVGDRKPLRLPEETARRGHERLAEDHRSDRHGSQERFPVVERLGAPAKRASEEALMVVGRLPVPVQPLDKVVERGTDRWQPAGEASHEWCGWLRDFSRVGQDPELVDPLEPHESAPNGGVCSTLFPVDYAMPAPAPTNRLGDGLGDEFPNEWPVIHVELPNLLFDSCKRPEECRRFLVAVDTS